MAESDPNAIFGHADSLTTFFLTCIVVVVGLYSVIAVSRLARVDLMFGMSIFAAYLLLGGVAYGVFGPFALGADGQVYDSQAMGVASDLGLSGVVASARDLNEGKWGWPTILGVLYRIGGRLPLLGVIINSALVGLTAIVIAKTSKIAFGDVNLWRCFLAFMLFPGFLILGPSLSREAFCWFLIALVASGYALFTSTRYKVTATLMVIAAIMLLLWIRLPLGLLAAFSIVVAFGLSTLWIIGKRMGLLVGTALVALAFLAFGTRVSALVGYDLQQIAVNRTYLSEAATSGFVVNAGPLGVFGPAGDILATFVHVLLGPFPWELGTTYVWAWISLNAVAWWVVLVLVWKNIHRIGNERLSVAFIAMILVILLGMGITLTNYGIVIRMRAIPFVILLIMLCGKPPKAVSTARVEIRRENRSSDKYWRHSRRILSGVSR